MKPSTQRRKANEVAMVQPFLLSFSDGPWIRVLDGNHTGRTIFDRHYSRYHYKDGRDPALFVGPGEKMVLLTACARALFVWRKFISGDGQEGVNCAVFRNEGAGISSDLIRAADALAFARWPGERHYTYINDRKVESRNPGYCFLKAGWRFLRSHDGARSRTKARRLLIMEILPEDGQRAEATA